MTANELFEEAQVAFSLKATSKAALSLLPRL